MYVFVMFIDCKYRLLNSPELVLRAADSSTIVSSSFSWREAQVNDQVSETERKALNIFTDAGMALFNSLHYNYENYL